MGPAGGLGTGRKDANHTRGEIRGDHRESTGSMPTSTEMSAAPAIAPLPRRMIFVVLAAFLGFFAGMAIGALFVPEGIGLAGPAFAVSYGVAGFWTVAVVAFVVTRRLSIPAFRRALLSMGILSLLVWTWVAWRAATVDPVSEPAPLLVEPVTAPMPGPPSDPG